MLKALYQSRGNKPVHLVQFDTHMDYWDEEGGSRFSHASPIIRSHEAGFIDGLTQYGIRSLHTPGDNIALAKSRGAHIFWCQQAKDMLVDDLVEHLPKGGDVYITFDIDALDPAIAPGTGTPEPGGFSYYEAKEILLAVCARCNVVGMDLVEVAPMYDGPGPGHGAARRAPDPGHGGRRVPQARGLQVGRTRRAGASASLRARGGPASHCAGPPSQELHAATRAPRAAALMLRPSALRIVHVDDEALVGFVSQIDHDRPLREVHVPELVTAVHVHRTGGDRVVEERVGVPGAEPAGRGAPRAGRSVAPCTCSSGTMMRRRVVHMTSNPRSLATRRVTSLISMRVFMPSVFPPRRSTIDRARCPRSRIRLRSVTVCCAASRTRALGRGAR